MSYRTELMEAILTSPQAQKIIDYVTPIYGEGYVSLWLFQAIGLILDEGESFPETYRDQVTPSTATWALDFWEKEYGIITDQSLSFEERRVNIMNIITNRRPINPKRIEDLVSSICGVAVKVLENTAKNTFTIQAQEWTDILNSVKEYVDEIKPAHLIYDTQVYLSTSVENKYRIFTTEVEELTVKVKNNTSVIVLTDEDGNILTDEDGVVLVL